MNLSDISFKAMIPLSDSLFLTGVRSVSEKLVRGKDGFLYCSLGHPLRAVQVKKTIYRTAHLQIHFLSLDLLKPGFLATEGL